MPLLSSASKEGRNVRYACRKPAQPLHSLGWLHCQSTTNAALGIGRPSCFQPWHVERFPHCALITFRWVLLCSCKTPQKKDPSWSHEWKKNGRATRQLVLSEAPLSNGVCSNPFCSGTVPLEKAPLSSLSFLQLSLRCSLFTKLPAVCVSRCDLEAPTVYFNVNIFFVEKQKGLEKGRLWEHSGWDKESEAEKNTPITSAHMLICQMKPVLPAVAQRQNTTGLLMSCWPLVMSPGKWVPGRERKRAVLLNASFIYLCSSSIN